MLGASAVPGLLLMAVALFAPESPRWLVKMSRRAEARTIMTTLRLARDPEPDLAEIETALSEEAHKASWGEVFDREWRRPLVIAFGLAIFQQITGINAIIYYANAIFAAAGFASADAQTTATTWAIGGVNVLATFIAIAYVDRLGRRPLLLVGLVGMGLSLLVVGLAFLAIDASRRRSRATGGPSTAGIVTLVALVVFIISFAFSLGPVVWTVISEIFPGRVRGRAVAVGDRRQLGRGIPGQPVLPHAHRRDRGRRDLLAVRVLLPRRLALDLAHACPKPRAARSRRSSGCGTRRRDRRQLDLTIPPDVSQGPKKALPPA